LWLPFRSSVINCHLMLGNLHMLLPATASAGRPSLTGRFPATAWAEGVGWPVPLPPDTQLNGRPFPATAWADGGQFNGPPFPATASAEGAQLNVPPSLRPPTHGRPQNDAVRLPVQLRRAWTAVAAATGCRPPGRRSRWTAWQRSGRR